jgi:hypothetical protein
MSSAAEQRPPDIRWPAVSVEQKAALNNAVDLIDFHLAQVLVDGIREHVKFPAFIKFLGTCPNNERILDFAARHPHMLPLPMGT